MVMLETRSVEPLFSHLSDLWSPAGSQFTQFTAADGFYFCKKSSGEVIAEMILKFLCT